jgi:hypothetical protein
MYELSHQFSHDNDILFLYFQTEHTIASILENHNEYFYMNKFGSFLETSTNTYWTDTKFEFLLGIIYFNFIFIFCCFIVFLLFHISIQQVENSKSSNIGILKFDFCQKQTHMYERFKIWAKV